MRGAVAGVFELAGSVAHGRAGQAEVGFLALAQSQFGVVGHLLPE